MHASTPVAQPNPFVRRHHARYHREDVPYHVISRTFQGTFLLRPNPELATLIAGVIGRAQECYPGARLYAYAFMSNHMHLIVSGAPEVVPDFIAFIKREISRRWAPKIGWRDAMWSGYLSTALPTEASQVQCLRYILSQGVKEDLVERPEEWPGLHCATQLLTGAAPRSVWLDATGYGRAKRRERERGPRVDTKPFERSPTLRLDPLPAWRHLDPAARAKAARTLCDEIADEGRHRRAGKRVLGVKGVLALSTRQTGACPRPPWFEERRRMVCWAAPNAPETRAYLEEYRNFQQEFRAASDRYLGGEDVEFPRGAFIPSVCVATRVARAGPAPKHGAA